MSKNEPKIFYGKICCDEGVITQREFYKEASALNWLQGAKDMLDALDPDGIPDTDIFACIDDKPAEDDE